MFIKHGKLHIQKEVKIPFITHFCKHMPKLLDPPLTLKQLDKAKSYRVVCERCNKKFVVQK